MTEPGTSIGWPMNPARTVPSSMDRMPPQGKIVFKSGWRRSARLDCSALMGSSSDAEILLLKQTFGPVFSF
jgi:hypothetical protein